MAVLSADGKKILNNYDRFTGVPFNATIYESLPSGEVLDNSIWFKNRDNFGGGFAKRDFDGSVNVKWFGAKGDGISDDTTAIQRAVNSNYPVFLPKGNYRITSSIIVRQKDFLGDGPTSTSLHVDADVHAIVINNGTFGSRNGAVIGKFAVMSPNNKCNNRYAVYAGGFVNSPELVYNVGLSLVDIEIGGNGGFGGGIHLSSFFRVNIERIGMTAVRNPIALIGSVVQISLDSITTNGDSIPQVSVLPNVGLLMSARDYNLGPFGTESLKTHSVSLVGNDTGVDYSGTLYISLTELDIDYVKNFGVVMGGPGVLERCYIASANTTSKFVGVSVIVPNNIDPLLTVIKDNIINAYVPLGSGSTAIQYGYGGLSPQIETLGGCIEGNSIQSPVVNGFTTGINADRTKGARIIGNLIKKDTCSGIEIVATNAKRITISDNICPSGKIIVDSPVNGLSSGVVTGNTATIEIGPGGIANDDRWYINLNDQDANDIKIGLDTLNSVTARNPNFLNNRVKWEMAGDNVGLMPGFATGINFYTNANAHKVLALQTDGKAVFGSSITTQAPSGSSEASFKVGGFTSGAVSAATGYISIDVNGTVYKIPVYT